MYLKLGAKVGARLGPSVAAQPSAAEVLYFSECVNVCVLHFKGLTLLNS